MKRIKILFASFISIVFIVIVIIYYLNIQHNKNESVSQDVYINNEYFDVEKKRINEKLLYYVFYDNDYIDKPISDGYKIKHPTSLIKELGLDKFDYRNNDPNSISNYYDLFIEVLNNNNIRIDTQYYSSLGSEPIVFSTIDMKYYIDDVGYLDDISIVNINKFRDDEGDVIIKSNSIKFFDNDLVLNYLQELIYGIDFINYKFKYYRNENFESEPYDEIISRFDMYAMTDKFKSEYDKNAGLINRSLIKEAIDNSFDIIVSVNFKKKHDNMLPLKLFKNDKVIKEGWLVLQVDKNGFLDKLEIKF